MLFNGALLRREDWLRHGLLLDLPELAEYAVPSEDGDVVRHNVVDAGA